MTAQSRELIRLRVLVQRLPKSNPERLLRGVEHADAMCEMAHRDLDRAQQRMREITRKLEAEIDMRWSSAEQQAAASAAPAPVETAVRS